MEYNFTLRKISFQVPKFIKQEREFFSNLIGIGFYMSQGQFQVQRVKKQKERILLSYTLILHEQRFSRFRTQYLNKKLEIKT